MTDRFAFIAKRVRRLPGDERGSVAVGFATAAIALLAAGGAAIDYSSASSQQSRLQAAADASALAGAREFRLGNTSETVLRQAVINFAKAAVPDRPDLKIEPKVDFPNRTVSVHLSLTTPTYMMQIFGQDTMTVTTMAKAKMVGGAPICVIGLDATAAQTIEMDKNARLTAPNCAVYSNSTKSNGLVARNNATIRAAFICSAGGKSNAKSDSFVAEPKLDCPVVPDPLASRPLPKPSGCLATALTVKGSMVNLSPGTYCGGLTITDKAKVNLNPGVYIFKDGALTVTGGGSLTGTNVGLHFDGKESVVRFDADSTIALTAPKTGELAGLLITEDRASPTSKKHDIASNNARTLLGTIYLPRGRLHIGANSPVADQSAYTIIVARVFSLSEGPNMVLNTNFGGTDIPVPVGVGPGGQTSLVE